jgi:hypothetical protein
MIFRPLGHAPRLWPHPHHPASLSVLLSPLAKTPSMSMFAHCTVTPEVVSENLDHDRDPAGAGIRPGRQGGAGQRGDRERDHGSGPLNRSSSHVLRRPFAAGSGVDGEIAHVSQSANRRYGFTTGSLRFPCGEDVMHHHRHAQRRGPPGWVCARRFVRPESRSIPGAAIPGPPWTPPRSSIRSLGRWVSPLEVSQGRAQLSA